MIKCPECGREISLAEGMIYCPYCAAQAARGKRRHRGCFKALLLGIGCLLLACALLFAFGALTVSNMDKSMALSGAKTAEVDLSIEDKLYYVGDIVRVKTELYPEMEGIPHISWSSSDEAVAVVDDIGRIEFVGSGSAVITAELNNGVKGNVEVTAYKKPEALSFSDMEIELVEGESVELSPIVTPDDAMCAPFEWESSDKSVVTVDENGIVTAVSAGRADITVRTAEKSAMLEVFVYKYDFDLLADRILREGELDDESRCVFYKVSYEETPDDEGMTVCKYVELVYFPEDGIITVCCDIYDNAVNMFYETNLDFERGNKRYGLLSFQCSIDNGENGHSHTTFLTARQLTAGGLTAHGNTRLMFDSYAPGDEVVFGSFDGDERMRDIAQQVACSMLKYSLETLSQKWKGMDVPCTIEDALGIKGL
ncbi:MAG: Ig-like domain-containing protein [Clostridia bacterium]|nr:Ig-like domain-containing protein [Clostridia bacterium]